MANTTSLTKVGSYRSALEFYRGRRKSNKYRNIRYSLDVHVSKQSLPQYLGNELGTINPDNARPACVWVRMHSTNIAEFLNPDYHPVYEFAILRTGGWLSSPTTRDKISELFGVSAKSRAFGPTLKARAAHGVECVALHVIGQDGKPSASTIDLPEHDMVLVRQRLNRDGDRTRGGWMYYAPLAGFDFKNPKPAEPLGWTFRVLTKDKRAILRRRVAAAWAEVAVYAAAELLNPVPMSGGYLNVRRALVSVLNDDMPLDGARLFEIIRRLPSWQAAVQGGCASMALAKRLFTSQVNEAKKHCLYSLDGDVRAETITVMPDTEAAISEWVAEAEA